MKKGIKIRVFRETATMLLISVLIGFCVNTYAADRVHRSVENEEIDTEGYISETKTFVYPDEHLPELEDQIRVFTAKDIDGNFFHVTDFNDDYTVVILGRPGCGKTKRVYEAAKEAKNQGKKVRILYLAVDDNLDKFNRFVLDDKETVWSDSYSDNHSFMWKLIRTADRATNIIALPVTLVIDSNGRLIFFHMTGHVTELKYGSTVAEDIKSLKKILEIDQDGIPETDGEKTKKIDVPNVEFTKIKKSKNGCVYLKWKKKDNIEGYEINYSLNKSFKKGKTKVISPQKTSTELKKLKKGEKYFIRIRAYDMYDGNQVNGKWSKTKQVWT